MNNYIFYFIIIILQLETDDNLEADQQPDSQMTFLGLFEDNKTGSKRWHEREKTYTQQWVESG